MNWIDRILFRKEAKAADKLDEISQLLHDLENEVKGRRYQCPYRKYCAMGFDDPNALLVHMHEEHEWERSMRLLENGVKLPDQEAKP